MERKQYATIELPSHADYKYIVIDGTVFINLAAKAPKLLAKFIRKGRASA